MKVAIGILLLIAVVLGWLLNSEMTITRQQRGEIEKLTSRLADKTKRENLELQEKCALQAEKVFRAAGWKADGQQYQSHFNSKLNKCFMTMEITATSPLTISRFLLDAYEQKEYGSFSWAAHKGVISCAITPPEEMRQICKSQEYGPSWKEYQAFVTRYME